MDDTNFDTAAPAAEVSAPPKPSLGELATALDTARSNLAVAQADYEAAGKAVKACVAAEREADKAFMDAVKDARPKRAPRKPKAVAEGGKAPNTPKAEKPAKGAKK